MNDLEQVFSPGHLWYNRIFYDKREGKYYDKHTDIYLELDQLKAYGLDK